MREGMVISVENDRFAIGYFSYPTFEQSERARLEREKINKLEAQIDYNNPKVVYSLYCKIISGAVFKSPEGILYLIHLQDYLFENEKYIGQTIPLIPYDINAVMQNTAKDMTDESGNAAASNMTSDENKDAEEITALKDKIRRLESERSKAYKELEIKKDKTDKFIYKLIIAALILVILAMFVIGKISGGPTILNYRNEIQNEYSEWQRLLEEKEQELNDRERELNGD